VLVYIPESSQSRAAPLRAAVQRAYNTYELRITAHYESLGEGGGRLSEERAG
jgi:hypothetical protein